MTTSSEFKCSVPVFVYPTSVNFYTNDTNSYKQVITLYNPYEFVIKFKVLCNAPKKFAVVDPEGLIKSKCCVDLVIRHLDVNPMNENLTDKLRIQIYQSNNAKTIIGKKDLPLTLLPRKLNNENDMNFGSFATMSSGAGGGNSLNSMFNINNTNFIPNTQLNQSKNGNENINYLVILIGVVCLVLLFMPTVGHTKDETQYLLPKYLHLTFEMKLCAAYILGMVTMAILKY